MIKKDMLKKIFGFAAILLLLATTLFTPVAKAEEGKWYTPTYEEFTRKVFGAPDSQIFGERYTMAQVFWIINSLPHVLTGSEVGTCMSASDPVGCTQDLVASGNLNGPIFAMAALADQPLQTRPVSGINYIVNTASNLNLVPEAYAQEGFGFQTLRPSLTLWRVVRNFSYALMILVVVAFAFMIMFRVKLSPQTVITVQSALPKMVIALLLITFSYAIAGLLVDLMYLLLGIVSVMFSGDISTLGPIELFGRLVAPATGNAWVFVAVSVIWLLVGAAIAGFAVVVSGGVGAGPVIFAGLLLIIGLLALLIALIRIWWLLIKSYIIVLLMVIAAPIYIILGALRSEMGAGLWIRSLLSNLIVFPVVGILVFLANFFTISMLPPEGAVVEFIKNSPVLNPFQFNTGLVEGSMQFPSWGSTGFPDIFGLFIGFGIILMIPTIAGSIKEIVGGKPLLQFGTGIGEALRYPTMAAGYPLGELAAGRIIDPDSRTAKVLDFIHRAGQTTGVFPRGGT